MEDQSEQLVWKRGGIPYHFGETFQFRMTGDDSVVLGLDAGLTLNPDGTYTGALVKGGAPVAFPIEGFWDVTLDVEHWTMTAELTGRYQWTMIGTINGGSWDQDVDLGDMGRQLVWENTKVPFHKGEEFKFRREKNNAVNLGIDGELVPVEGVENQYVANLKQDGGNITLPAEGYWTLRLDVEAATLTATLTDVFPRAGVIWESDGTGGPVSWSSQYRIGLDGKDGGGECIATLPPDVWNKLLTQTCYLVVEATNPQIRITTGWWGAQYGSDFMPGNERLKDNGDGTFTLKLDLADDPAFGGRTTERMAPSAGPATIASAWKAGTATTSASRPSRRRSGTSSGPRPSMSTWRPRTRRSASPPAGGPRPGRAATSSPATSVSRTTATAPTRWPST